MFFVTKYLLTEHGTDSRGRQNYGSRIVDARTKISLYPYWPLTQAHRKEEAFADEFGGQLDGFLLGDIADEDLAYLALRTAVDGYVCPVQVLC